MTRKRCSKCGINKSITSFYRAGQGHMSRCRDCVIDSTRLRAHAYGFALSLLRDRHRDEFDKLYERAKQEVRA